MGIRITGGAKPARTRQRAGSGTIVAAVTEEEVLSMRSRLLGCALAMTAMSVVAASGQSEVKRTTKVEVKGGKDLTTSGCVERISDGRYSLTGVGGEVQYILVGHENVAKRLGHRVQVHGKATDLGDAQVKTETKTSTRNRNG